MGKPNPRRSNGTRRNAIIKRWRYIGAPCAICGMPIDYSLPPGHPMSFEVDEIVPVSKGGDPLCFANTQPAHRICNQRKGNAMMRPKRGAGGASSMALPQSRAW